MSLDNVLPKTDLSSLPGGVNSRKFVNPAEAILGIIDAVGELTDEEGDRAAQLLNTEVYL